MRRCAPKRHVCFFNLFPVSPPLNDASYREIVARLAKLSIVEQQQLIDAMGPSAIGSISQFKAADYM